MSQPKAIIVVCSLHSELGRSRSFDLREFVELEHGSRVLVRSDRGWTTGASWDGDPWLYETEASITSEALSLWDLYLEEEEGLHWAVPILQQHGVRTDSTDLESLPVVVELSAEILERLP